MRKARRGRLAATLVAVVAVALGAFLGTFGAEGATPEAANWGTFAHIATNDIQTASARQALARRYDLIALRGPLDPQIFSDIRAARPGITVLAYEKAAGLSQRDVADISAVNPEWLARDASGNRISPNGIPDTTLGDLTNPGFRQWQANKFAVEVGQGADGAFVDTVGAYFPDDFYTARPVVNGAPVTDAAWRDGSIDLIRKIRAATAKPVFVNGFGVQNGKNYVEHQADANALINASDGVQIESFTRNGGMDATQYLSAARWDQDLALLQTIGALGKTALAYTKVKVNASAAQLAALRDYALGSFLLAYSPGRAYFGFDDAPIPTVASDTPWGRALGTPTTPKYRSATNEWTRQFGSSRLTVRAQSAPVVTGTASNTTAVAPTTTTTTGGVTTTTAGPTTTAAPTTTTRAPTTTTRAPTTTTTTRPPTSGRQTATFTGSGPHRVAHRISMGAGSITARITSPGQWAYWTMWIQNQAGSMVAGYAGGYSPVTLTATLPAGVYDVVLQGNDSSPYTLQVEYPA